MQATGRGLSSTEHGTTGTHQASLQPAMTGAEGESTTVVDQIATAALRQIPDIVSAENREFIRKRVIAQYAEAKQVQASTTNHPEQAAEFLQKAMPPIVQALISLADTINFSRGYEQAARTFPTNEQLKELVDMTLGLRDKLNLFSTVQGFIKQFDICLKPFLVHLERRIKDQALASRNAQLETLLNPADSGSEYQRDVCMGHLVMLREKPSAHWSELRDLLNLGANPSIPRQHTEREKEFYFFLGNVLDRIKD